MAAITHSPTDRGTGESTKLLLAVRRRPTLNEQEGHQADMVISENTRLILSLEVFFDPEETIYRVSHRATNRTEFLSFSSFPGSCS